MMEKQVYRWVAMVLSLVLILGMGFPGTTLAAADGGTSGEGGTESAAQEEKETITIQLRESGQAGAQSEAESISESESETQSASESEKESEKESESESDSPAIPDETGRLKIEDTCIYTGMTKAYKDGYTPVIENNEAVIVLPIEAGDEGSISEITVVPNLGDTASSPFVYKNYQKTFKETEETVNGGSGTRRVFLIVYRLALNKDRLNGIYPVVFDMTAKSGSLQFNQSFTVYVNITDGKSRDSEQGEVAVDNGGGIQEETPESQPKLILSKCLATPSRIEAGNSFELAVEIENTNKKFHVQNMTIDISWTEPGLTLEADSKTFYVEELGAGETMELPLHFKAGSNVAEGRYDIVFNMSYDNPEAVSLTSMGTVSVDIHQAMKVELEAAEFPTSINAGDTLSLSVQAMNLGRGPVYNARCLVDAPGLSSGTSLFFGNMEAGSAVSGELKIFAGMKDEEQYGSAYGATSGHLILYYEDEDGNVYEEKLEVSTTVNPLVVQAPVEEEPEEAPGLALQWVIGVAVIAVLLLVVLLYILKKKKAVR